MRKLIVVVFVLLGCGQVFAQIESKHKSYSLRTRGEQIQGERQGVLIFESNMNEFPSAWEIIPLGGGRGVIHQQIENWTTDTVWVHSRRYKYEGTYPFKRLKRFYTYPSENEVVTYDNGIIDMREVPFSIPPDGGIYLWTGTRTSEIDKTTGSLVFKMPDSSYISLSSKQYQFEEVICSGYFPQNLLESWIGARTTWIDTSVVNVEVVNLNSDLKVFPNPVSEQANLSFNLENCGNISVEITDILGNIVAEILNNKYLETGEHKIEFDSSKLPVGVYFCNLRFGDKIETEKIIIMK